MAVLTKGTHLYFLDPDGDVVTRVTCPTNINGLNSPRDQIETTCLESTDAEYLPGLGRPGNASITLQFDPADASHLRLFEIREDPTITNMFWAIGFSDGTAPPTSGDSTGFVLPTTRSWLEFEGYLTDVPFDFSLNAVVVSTVGLQVSGARTLTPKTT